MRYLIIVLLVLAACAQPIVQEPVPLCNPPYLEWRLGECCLDANQNRICDNQEQVIIEEPVVKEKKPTRIQTFLEKVPEKYTYFSPETELVFVVGSKRRVFLNVVKAGATDMYWDLAQQKAYEVCDSKEEILQMGEHYNEDIAKCEPDSTTVRELSPMEYQARLHQIKGPVEWMYEYQFKEPYKVEETLQQLKIRGIKPVLHFMEGDVFVTMRFDSYYKIPLRIEKTRYVGEVPIKDIITYMFQTTGIKNNPLTEETVTVPEEELHRGPWIENYKLLIDSARVKAYNTLKIQGYLKNQGRYESREGRVRITCYDRARTIIGEQDVSFGSLEPRERQTFSIEIYAPTEEFDDCTATLISS